MYKICWWDCCSNKNDLVKNMTAKLRICDRKPSTDFKNNNPFNGSLYSAIRASWCQI